MGDAVRSMTLWRREGVPPEWCPGWGAKPRVASAGARTVCPLQWGVGAVCFLCELGRKAGRGGGQGASERGGMMQLQRGESKDLGCPP